MRVLGSWKHARIRPYYERGSALACDPPVPGRVNATRLVQEVVQYEVAAIGLGNQNGVPISASRLYDGQGQGPGSPTERQEPSALFQRVVFAVALGTILARRRICDWKAPVVSPAAARGVSDRLNEGVDLTIYYSKLCPPTGCQQRLLTDFIGYCALAAPLD
jgi:hypothetical protein